MHHTLPLAFALLATQAHAQGICAGFSPAGPATMTEAAPEWAALPCVPDVIGGTGKGYNVRVSAAGVVPWVWCPSGTGWALRWAAATWADAAPIAAELPAALAATDKRAALARIGDVHLSRDIADPALKALWCPHWQAMKDSMPRAEVWWVAKAPATANPPGTRPAYHYQAGVMVNAQQRVAEYTLCQPNVARLVLDKITWCSTTSGGVLWAVAVKRP